MSLTVRKYIEVPVDTLRISVAVRYEEEDIPNDFPFRKGDMWTVNVDLATWRIKDWPAGRNATVYMKVCDQGVYTLLAGVQEVASVDGYVPHGLVPGEYGDYLDLKIGGDGTILNAPKRPSTQGFGDWKEDE